MTTYKLQVHLIVITAARQRLFLRWALEGFRKGKIGVSVNLLQTGLHEAAGSSDWRVP